MEKHPVLFITRRQQVHQRAALAAAPAELDICMLQNPSKEQVLSVIGGMEFLIMEREGKVDAEMIAAGRSLRLVQWLGSQIWNIDLEAAKSAGIPVCYMPVKGCVHVAEHVIMQILSVIRHSREVSGLILQRDGNDPPPTLCDEDTFRYNWKGYTKIVGLWKKRVGILGFGEIGCEVARRLKGFECEVLYYKRTRLPEYVEAELGLTYASEDGLAHECDVVCALLPFYPATNQRLNDRFFSMMKPNTFFVSSGGSGTINEEALARALRTGRLAGAAVDNFTWEPPQPSNPLFELAADPKYNLLLTPHVAAGTEPANRALDYANIQRLLSGESLQYQVA
jgi:phosphoglycerate dehydrogenase-like enzyme